MEKWLKPNEPNLRITPEKTSNREADGQKGQGSSIHAWQQHEGLWWKNRGDVPNGAEACETIIAFDFDGTLIRTKSGKTHPQSPDDWVPFHSSVKPKLKSLAKAENCKIVIFSNQRGVTTNNTSIENIQSRFDAVLNFYDVPAQMFIAIADDIFRKPRRGMWDYMVSHCNGGVGPKLDKCVFVGDAAGRLKTSQRKTRDFTDTDLKFSLNIGIKFLTPEEYFLDSAQVYPQSFVFDPRLLPRPNTPLPSFLAPRDHQEVIILIGPPGSGKTYLCRTVFPNYVHVNQDTLKTADKCLKTVEAALKKGASVIIDNQNKDSKMRKKYINIAGSILEKPVPVRAIYFNLKKDFCFHMNAYRSIRVGSHEHRPSKVPPMVIHSFYKNVEKPQATEFTETFEINETNFVPGPFEDVKSEKCFYAFLQ